MKEKGNILRDKGYKIVLEEDPVVGGFTVSVLEFPGCVSEGETPGEAYDRITAAAESWVAATEAMGQEVPPPLHGAECSGRVSLRMPRGLHTRLSVLATAERISLNSLMVAMLAEAAGVRAGAQRGATTFHFNVFQHGRISIPDLSLRNMNQSSQTREIEYEQ
jgi:predicted RNase H-like HicB family nuclease